MPTKSESARINGAKSRGPKTEAGRRRSSQNTLKHGLTAQTLLLPSEDPDEFQHLLASYLDQFQPDGPAELHLVHEMVAAKWRLQRLAIIETQLYIESMEHVQEDSDDPLGPVESLTAAFTWLANSNSYPFLHRVESRLERTYSRALRNLIQLQRLRHATDQRRDALTPTENEICTNEPTGPAQPNGHFTLDPPALIAKPISPITPPIFDPVPSRSETDALGPAAFPVPSMCVPQPDSSHPTIF